MQCSCQVYALDQPPRPNLTGGVSSIAEKKGRSQSTFHKPSGPFKASPHHSMKIQYNADSLLRSRTTLQTVKDHTHLTSHNVSVIICRLYCCVPYAGTREHARSLIGLMSFVTSYETSDPNQQAARLQAATEQLRGVGIHVSRRHSDWLLRVDRHPDFDPVESRRVDQVRFAALKMTNPPIRPVLTDSSLLLGRESKTSLPEGSVVIDGSMYCGTGAVTALRVHIPTLHNKGYDFLSPTHHPFRAIVRNWRKRAGSQPRYYRIQLPAVWNLFREFRTTTSHTGQRCRTGLV
jgi:hypothetical protein